MNGRIRIAVTGAGGGVGQSIIKSLQGTEYDVVALDSDPLATGLYAARTSHLVPPPFEPSYVDHVLDICQAEDCRLLFPGLDTELSAFSTAIDRFRHVGTTAVVSTPDVIELSDNKHLTHQTLAKHDISVPETIDLADHRAGDHIPLPFPFILKKREGGSRSRDVYLIRSAEDLRSHVTRLGDLTPYVAQAYIEGEEYTCGSVNLDGRCWGVIAMRRTLRNGDTYKSFTVRHPIIEAEVSRAMNAVKPFGACNVQLRMQDGRPYVFEINARCSGTTAARTLCGFNEPKMIADYLCHGIQPTYAIEEQTILRYWAELVVPNEAVGRLAGSTVFDQPRPRFL